MSILTSASRNSVSRGYDYYKSNNVLSFVKLNDIEYKGKVQGSGSKTYDVIINVKHPKKSFCDCPFANGNITCKHMVALYFEIFPDEASDYEDWINSSYEDDDYYEEDYYYEGDDYYEDGYYHKKKFCKPLFFNAALNNFVDSLSHEKLKEYLINELKMDEERTYHLFLEANYNNFLGSNKSELLFLNIINERITKITNYIDYNYNRFNDKILTESEKKKIELMYKNESIKVIIDEMLLNEKLTSFYDFEWIAKFYKKYGDPIIINTFVEKTKQYFDSLKHYSIKNEIPKSNTLIALYILQDNNLIDTANMIYNNSKYSNFVEYVIRKNNNKNGLYKEFLKLIDKNYLKNKEYIPDVLGIFSIFDPDNIEKMKIEYLYSFICLENYNYLNLISNECSEEEVLSFVESKTKNINVLTMLYRFYNKIDEIWNLYIKNENNYLLINNIDILKVKYNTDLYNCFKKEFYNTLSNGKNREIYYLACKYISAINELNNGDKYINNIIKDLEKSEYSKCKALFEEIEKAKNNI